MKSSMVSILASFCPTAKSPLLPALALALSLGGCHNYTTSPLCTADNSIDPMDIPGIVGVYELTVQDSEFANTTHIFDLTTKAADFQALSDGAVCAVGAHYYTQEQDDYGLGYWSYQRMVVSGTGIGFFDVVFDRPSLDAAGLATWTFEIPETLRHVLGSQLSQHIEVSLQELVNASKEQLGLVIDNAGWAPEALLEHAAAVPVGLTLTRQ